MGSPRTSSSGADEDADDDEVGDELDVALELAVEDAVDEELAVVLALEVALALAVAVLVAIETLAVALPLGTDAKGELDVVAEPLSDAEPLADLLAEADLEAEAERLDERLALELRDAAAVREGEPLAVPLGVQLGAVGLLVALGERLGAEERVGEAVAEGDREGTALRDGEPEIVVVRDTDDERVGVGLPELLRVAGGERVAEGLTVTLGVEAEVTEPDGVTVDEREVRGEVEGVRLAELLRDTEMLWVVVAVCRTTVGDDEAEALDVEDPEPLADTLGDDEGVGELVALADAEALGEEETVGTATDRVALGLDVELRETVMEREGVGELVSDLVGRRE